MRRERYYVCVMQLTFLQRCEVVAENLNKVAIERMNLFSRALGDERAMSCRVLQMYVCVHACVDVFPLQR